ncbi:MAG: cytochrome c maturation protein CcmE [Desertimonas sp.]
MDLTPRTASDTATTSPSRRRWGPLIVVALVLIAGGVIVTQFLRSAVDYYCNVDEIGQRDGCDAGRRLRVQGVVDAGTVEVADGTTTFTMSFGGATIPVSYDGEPGGIFEECQPVVVHGRLDDRGALEGDRVEVKHDEVYEAENGERLDESALSSQAVGCDGGT